MLEARNSTVHQALETSLQHVPRACLKIVTAAVVYRTDKPRSSNYTKY